jgi:four helix bundle protein
MDYRELGFYQKARQVTMLINSELKTWPKTMQAQEIARQLFRASTSIGANIAEGHGRHMGPEYIHFQIIAQGSANEVDNWLNTVLDCGIGNSDNIKRILALNLETRKMLSGSINSLRNQDSKSIYESPFPYSLNPSPDEDIELGQDKS